MQHGDIDVLEGSQEGNEFHGEFSAVPWPNNEYLRRVGNKRNQTEDKVDD
jgi:hypothetical protein